MTKEEVFDINGVNPKIGDTIAVARGWTTNNAYLDIAVIDDIVETPKTVTLKLHTIHCGLYGVNKENSEYYTKYNIKFPMEHCKFIIIG